MRGLIAVAAAAVLLTACTDQGARTPNPAAEAQREPAEQSFGPVYPDNRPAGRATRIDTAVLSADKRTLTITFVGGKPYLASDPCSQDYEPWVALRGDELDVAVFNVVRPEQAKLGPNEGCTLEGYGLTYHLALAAPFTGTIANDVSGGTLFVSTPPAAVVATALPKGWTLQKEFEQEPGPPAIWVEVYGAGPVAEEPEGPGRLVLYQAFGVVGEWSDTRTEKSRERGGKPVSVPMGIDTAMVWVDSVSGELLLPWTLNGQSVALIGNSADMTPEQLAAYGLGVAPRAK